jgi:polyisoprenoid-binding protein YceI
MAIDSPQAGTYRIDSGASSIAFTTTHLFGLGKVRGTMRLSGGSVTVGTHVADSAVTAQVSATSFETGSKSRDTAVLSPRFLDVEKNPEMAFRAAGLRQGAQGWALDGQLTVAGTTAPVTVAIDDVRSDATSLTATGTASIDRFDFGVTKAKGMAGRHLDITVTLVATVTAETT